MHLMLISRQTKADKREFELKGVLLGNVRNLFHSQMRGELECLLPVEKIAVHVQRFLGR